MASSGSFYSNLITYSGEGYTLYTDFRFDWEITSQNPTNLTSTIAWTVTTRQTFDSARQQPAGSGYQRGVRSGSAISVNGTSYSIASQINAYNGLKVQQGTTTITHNEDGTKSFTVTFAYKIGSSSVNCRGSQTFTLDPLALNPMIYYKVGGVQKKAYPLIKVGGAYKSVAEVYQKVGGVWKASAERG